MNPEGDDRVVVARDLVRRFGDLVAVDGVDLEIRRGEVFGFLGPNGAGKSTLIRMLVGLMPATSGEARVLGYTLPREAERLRSEIGYMTQRFSLYEDLTVVENLRFAGEIFGLRGGDLEEHVEGALRNYGLVGRRRQLPATLSGGWKQRLALAVATLHQPELLVLDEPTAGVDPANRRVFWERIFEIARDGKTVLVSTHYMDEAVRCHRLCLLHDGRRVALGSPRELTGRLEDRVLEVVVDDPARVLSLIRGQPWVESVAQLGHRLHVLIEDEGPEPEVAAAELAWELTEVGISGVCEATEPTLEDVFVDLAGEGALSWREAE